MRTAVEGARRFPVSLRVTPELREHLGDAAKASGRSLAQEVERRLERSADLDLLFGGPELRVVALAMASAFAYGGALKAERAAPDASPPSEWLQQPDAVIFAITCVVLDQVIMHGLTKVDRRRLLRTMQEHVTNLDQGQLR